MKKTTLVTLKKEKLQLSRETLRNLEQSDLMAIAGGLTLTTCSPAACNTRNTCTTTYC
jgi:hypothetical protein